MLISIGILTISIYKKTSENEDQIESNSKTKTSANATLKLCTSVVMLVSHDPINIRYKNCMKLVTMTL
jgi:hypothetical protein